MVIWIDGGYIMIYYVRVSRIQYQDIMGFRIADRYIKMRVFGDCAMGLKGIPDHILGDGDVLRSDCSKGTVKGRMIEYLRRG